MSVSSRRSQSGLLQATSCRMMEKTGLPGIKISSFWFLHVTISLLHSWHHSLPTFFWWFSLCWLLWQPMNLMEKVIHISLFPPSRSYVAKEISWWDAGARGLCSYSSSGRQRGQTQSKRSVPVPAERTGEILHCWPGKSGRVVNRNWWLEKDFRGWDSVYPHAWEACKHCYTLVESCWQAVRLALSLGSGYPEDGKQQSGILQFGIVPCYPTLELYQRSVLPSCSLWKAKEGGVVPTHIIILHKEINCYLLSLQVSRAWSRMVVKQQSPPLPNHNHFLLAPSRPYLWGTDTLSITICPWNNVFVRAGRNTCHERCQWYFFVYIFPKSPQNSTNPDNFFVSRASKTILCPSRAYTFLFCYCCILRWMRLSFSEVDEFWR